MFVVLEIEPPQYEFMGAYMDANQEYDVSIRYGPQKRSGVELTLAVERSRSTAARSVRGHSNYTIHDTASERRHLPRCCEDLVESGSAE